MRKESLKSEKARRDSILIRYGAAPISVPISKHEIKLEKLYVNRIKEKIQSCEDYGQYLFQ